MWSNTLILLDMKQTHKIVALFKFSCTNSAGSCYSGTLSSLLNGATIRDTATASSPPLLCFFLSGHHRVGSLWEHHPDFLALSPVVSFSCLGCLPSNERCWPVSCCLHCNGILPIPGLTAPCISCPLTSLMLNCHPHQWELFLAVGVLLLLT